MSDPFDLQRFVTAQQQNIAAALDELRHGAKRSHWMWYVFPQIAGLGTSAMAQRYAIASLEEAKAYLAHPVLGPRYRECVAALAALPPTTAERVFGPVDAAKLRSSLTLFRAASAEPQLQAALDRWFDGEPDPATLRILG
jgi:uncharacterized protein (DUF1810 family)